MSVTCYLQNSSKGDQIVKEFAHGCNGSLKKIDSFIKDRYIDNDLPVFIWGCLRGNDLLLKYCLENNHPFFYGDNNYFSSNNWFRISKNSLQNINFRDRGNERLLKMQIKIDPWRKQGDHILLLPPTESFQIIFNKQNWCKDIINELKKYTDRPIKIRHKPTETTISWENGYMINGGTINRAEFSKTSFNEDLENCWAVVAFQSSAVNDAIAAGVPAFVDTMNAASVMGNTDLSLIESPIYKDQYQYFKHLSYCQFSRKEILNGTAWRIINGTR